METGPREGQALRLALIGLPLLKLAIHLAAAFGFGYFRDEFYYLACSRRLAWGYVDHPPFSVAALRAWTALFGESVWAIRALPALVGAATVLLTGLIARALGGAAFAATLAMLCVTAAPVYLGVNGYYSMNSFDMLFWTLAAYLLVRILEQGEERLWPVLGVVLGLGLQNKLSVLWLGFGLGVGLLLTGERRRLLTRGPWLAGAIAAVLFLPHVVWQWQNDWPTAEFIRRATGDKMKAVSPLSFAAAQVMNMHPLTAPVWLAGLGYTLLGPRARPLRVLGLLYLAVFTLLVVNEKSRPAYLAPAYPMLLAAGAVWIAAHLRARWLRALACLVIALGGILTAPLALMVLPPEQYVAYAARLGVTASTDEKKEVGPLPQFFADRFGWPEMVERVRSVYLSLPPEERGRASVLTGNYGEAGALEVLWPPGERPPVLSGHNNYWLWGPGPGPADPLITVLPASARGVLDAACGRVDDRGPIGCAYCMPYERESRVVVCHGLKVPLAERWPMLKHYD